MSDAVAQRSGYDVFRSLARYIAVALDDDWEIGLATRAGVHSRPAALIRRSAPRQLEGSFHTTTATQPFLIHAYPLPGTDKYDKPDPDESERIAAAVEDLLEQAFRVGVDEGRSMRMPLYDYEGVGLDDVSTKRAKSDYAEVIDLSVGSTQNPDDENLWTVSVEVRLRWRRSALVPSDANLVEQVRTTINPG